MLPKKEKEHLAHAPLSHRTHAPPISKGHHKHRTVSHKSPSVSGGLIFLMVFVVIIYLLFYNKEVLLSALEKSPFLWGMYQHIMVQIEDRTLLGLFYASTFGSLFFITFPVEVIFLYYASLDYSHVSLIMVTLFGGVLGMLFNYGVGFLLGAKLLQLFMKKSYEKLKSINDKYGTLIVLFGNIIISPIEPLALLLGATRYPIKKFIFYTALGRMIKFLLLLVGRDYFLGVVVPWVQSIF